MPDPAPDSGTPQPNAAPPVSNIVSDITDDDLRRDRILKGEAALTERKIGLEGMLASEEARRSADYRSRMEGMIEREGHSADELKPWNAEQELQSRKTDLWSQFGSPGFVIGQIASAFSGYPMVSSLNAGAAAMNAINQGDMKSYEKAFEAWKENSDLAIKRINLEHQQFADIDKLRATDLAEWRVKSEVLLNQFNDQRKLMLLRNGMDDEYFKLRDAEIESSKKLAESRTAILEQHAVLMAVQNDPDYKSGDPQKMLEAVTRAEKKVNEAKYAGRYGARSLTPVFGEIQRQITAWDDQHPDASSEDRAAAHNAIISSVQTANRPASSNAATAKVRDIEEIKTDVRNEHPEWSPGQVDIEARKRMKEAETPPKPLTSGGQRANDIEDVKKTVREEHPEWGPGQVDLEARKRMKEAEASPITGNKRYDVQAHIALYDDAVKIIDQVTDTLHKYVGAAGLPGRVARLSERVSNLAGGTQTDRVQLARDIRQLQFMAPQLLMDRNTGRSLSAEHGAIEEIIAGLSIGDTTANTLRAMAEIRDRLDTIRQRDRARLGGGKDMPGDATPAPAKPAASWSDFPAVH